MSDRIKASELRRLLRYDRATGHFTWRVNRGGGHVPGKRAGHVTPKGYRMIRVNGQGYLEHLLAWLYVKGRWPKSQIDHRNEVKSDNWFKNLRDVSGPLNLQNRSFPKSDNQAGWLGVSPQGSAFLAHIGLNGEQFYLGRFPNPEMAHGAYTMAKALMHPGWLRTYQKEKNKCAF